MSHSVSFEEHAEDDDILTFPTSTRNPKAVVRLLYFFLQIVYRFSDVRCTHLWHTDISQGLHSAGTYDEAFEIPNDVQ